ncbi:MAG: DUF4097 family beta strand repeat-containing protein [Clostridia bacterium]|jgi:hypothetical protein
MTRTVKALLSGAVLCVLGFAVAFLGYYMNGYRTDNILIMADTADATLFQKTYSSSDPDALTLISITTKRMPVTVMTHEGPDITVEYYESEEQTFLITEERGKLFIKRNDLKLFDEYVTSAINAWFFRLKGIPNEIIIYMPSSYDQELIISTSSGDISIPEPLAFSGIKKIDFKTVNGDISMQSLSGNIANLKTSKGVIACNDMKFNNFTVISTKGTITLNYIDANVLEIRTADSITQAVNIQADDITVETTDGSIRLDILGYMVEYDITTSCKGDGVLNISDQTGSDEAKDLTVFVEDTKATVTFSLDK